MIRQSAGEGKIVQFNIVEGAKGTEAANVKKRGGGPVRGSPYTANKRPFRSRWSPRQDQYLLVLDSKCGPMQDGTRELAETQRPEQPPCWAS